MLEKEISSQNHYFLGIIIEYANECGSPPDHDNTQPEDENSNHLDFKIGLEEEFENSNNSPENSPNLNNKINSSSPSSSKNFNNNFQFNLPKSNSKSNMMLPHNHIQKSSAIYNKIQARKNLEQKAIQKAKQGLLVIEDRPFVRVSTSPNLDYGKMGEVVMIDSTRKPLAQTMKLQTHASLKG